MIEPLNIVFILYISFVLYYIFRAEIIKFMKWPYAFVYRLCEFVKERQYHRVFSVESSIKITDLNSDCLEKIFDHLSAFELVNVADSNTQLKNVAETVYKRKYSQLVLLLNPRGKVSFGVSFALSHSCYEKNVCEESQIARILHFIFRSRTLRSLFPIYCDDSCGRTMKMAFPLLRCFGHLITSLKLCNVNNRKGSFVPNLCHIDTYISKYCTKSLVRIHLAGISAVDFVHVDKPFPNIEVLEFERCLIGSKLSQFNRWFPKMRHLYINESVFVRRGDLMEHFPDLEELTLVTSESIYSRDSEFTQECYEVMLALNLQLKKFKTNIDSEKIKRHLREIEYRNIHS